VKRVDGCAEGRARYKSNGERGKNRAGFGRRVWPASNVVLRRRQGNERPEGGGEATVDDRKAGGASVSNNEACKNTGGRYKLDWGGRLAGKHGEDSESGRRDSHAPLCSNRGKKHMSRVG